jgi:hypothetical protein
MACAQLGDLLQARRQPVELTAATQVFHRAELFVRGTAGPDQVGVVGVGKTIGTRASCREHGTFLEEAHGLRSAGEGEDIGDRFESLRICDRVTPAIEYGELDSLLTHKARQELGPFGTRAPNLEMRGARPAQRAASEQCSANVRSAAA